jgi:hypothetical protein
MAADFHNATSVFRARVTEVRLATLTNPSDKTRTVEIVEAKYQLKEVFKGRPPEDGIVRDLPFGPGNCSLGRLPGLEYVFFPATQAMVLVPTGSFSYFNMEGTEVVPKLKELRELASTERPR